MPREGSRETYRIHQGRVVIVVPRIKVINVLYVFHAVNFSLTNGEKHCCSNGMTTMYNSYQSNSRTRVQELGRTVGAGLEIERPQHVLHSRNYTRYRYTVNV